MAATGMKLDAEERACVSAFTAAWFALATVVLPTLHLVGHESDHTHGSPVRTDERIHVHRPGSGESSHTHPDAGRGHEQGSSPEDEDHGKGSLAHFAAAFAPGVIAVEPARSTRTAPLPAAKQAVHRATALELLVARGPPTPTP